MSKKSLSALKLSAAAVILAAGLGVSGTTSEAVFDAPYYDITKVGGSFNGSQYVLNGTTVTDSFFCDGTYTYFLQTDGTPMKDRLTYHPDGKQVIYFDADGHECFDTFAHVKKSIAGDAVDDLCYFGTYGNLYVNVITYNKEGTAIYYANKYGVMERSGVFEVSSDAVNYSALANGCKYGYANSDGTVKGFYATYEEAAVQTDAGQNNGNSDNNNADKPDGWEKFETITYDGNGKQISRQVWEGDSYKIYEDNGNGGEYLYIDYTDYCDDNQNHSGYSMKTYGLKSNGKTYLRSVANGQEPLNGNWSYQKTSYDENGKENGTTVREYNGSDLIKEVSNSWGENGKSESVTVYNYENGNVKRQEYYSTDIYSSGSVHTYSEYSDFTYITVAGKEVMSRMDNYYINSDNTAKLSYYILYDYDENANCISTNLHQIYRGIESGGTSESTYSYIGNEWVCTKDLHYKFDSNGKKVPSFGFEKYYENNKLSQYNSYLGTDDDSWALIWYTVYNNYNFPQDTSQTVTFEASRTYDGDGNLKEYIVECWHFVQK